MWQQYKHYSVVLLGKKKKTKLGQRVKLHSTQNFKFIFQIEFLNKLYILNTLYSILLVMNVEANFRTEHHHKSYNNTCKQLHKDENINLAQKSQKQKILVILICFQKYIKIIKNIDKICKYTLATSHRHFLRNFQIQTQNKIMH